MHLAAADRQQFGIEQHIVMRAELHCISDLKGEALYSA
jgi:hypothetical protein